MPETATRAGPSILVVDDDVDILNALQSLLRQELPRAHVAAASDGEEALRFLARRPIHLMLLDYRMPGLNGFEVAMRARELQSNIQIVLMTAYADPEIAAKAVHDYGIGLVLAKPFDLSYFAQIVSSLAERLSQSSPASLLKPRTRLVEDPSRAPREAPRLP